MTQTQTADLLDMSRSRVSAASGASPSAPAADKAAMMALPPVAPATGWRASTRLARDHHIGLDHNDYSVLSARV